MLNEYKKLENILIIDTETSGLNPSTEPLLEVGAILYNVPTKSILLKTTAFLHGTINNAFHINKIDIHWLSKVDHVIQLSHLNLIAIMLSKSDMVIAHNAKFDKSFLENNQLLKCFSQEANWICSAWDIKWPFTKDKKLATLASHFGIDYSKAHRALDDCEILLECLLKLETFEDQLQKFFIKRI